MGFRVLALLALMGLATVNSQFGESNPSCALCLDGKCFKTNDTISIVEIYLLGEQVAIDRPGNILYYHTGDQIQSLNLEDNEVEILQRRIFSTYLAVDQGTRDLYYTSGNDIVKYNPVSNSTVYILGSEEIKNLYFKDKLYAISAGSKPRLHVLKDSKFELFAPLRNVNVTDDIMIDKRGDLYFRQGVSTHRLPAGSNASVVINDHKHLVFTTDKNDVPYFIEKTLKRTYRLNHETNELVKVGVFDLNTFTNGKVGSVHFDKHNNLYVAVEVINNHMFQVTPNVGSCRMKEEKNILGEIVPTIETL